MKPTSTTIMGILLAIILAVPAWAGRPIPDCGWMVYGINEMSFTKLDAAGNDLPDDALEWAMVRDNVTGLIWEVKQNKDAALDETNHHDADNTYKWYDPTDESTWGDGETTFDTRQFIQALNDTNFGGFNDWRMPARDELRSIVDYSVTNSGQAIESGFFPKTASYHYWSSSTVANTSSYAWGVNFYDGHDDYDSLTFKSNAWYVRAVRGGQSRSLDHWVINGDGTVTDKSTGLMWEQKTDDGGERDKDNQYTWSAAAAYCEQSTLAGYLDWRLPTIKELASIVDIGRYDPAIDSEYFPNIVFSDHWSSSTYAYNAGAAWSIIFDDGDDYGRLKSSSRYVRAVRGGQSRLLGHLVIFEPLQASCWDIGSIMPIEWDTAGIGGDVKIEYSPDGGKSFTTIGTAGDPANDGRFDWPIDVSPTYNGYLKITPLADPGKATEIGMFSIQNYIDITPTGLTVSETPGSDSATFTVSLTLEPVADVKIQFHSSDADQCIVSPPTVILNAGNWPDGVVVTVTALDDDLLDGDKNIVIRAVRIDSMDPDYRDMSVPTVNVTVRDDEVAPALTVDSVQPNIVEVFHDLSTTLFGTGLTDIETVYLVLEDENGDPVWSQTVTASQFFPLDTRMGVVFPTFSQTGHYTLLVSKNNNGGIAEVKGAVTVAESSEVQDLQGKKAIIVAGRENATDSLWVSTMNNANRAYNALSFQGFTNDNNNKRIKYLTHMANMDVDGNGQTDVDGVPTKTALQSAVTTWAADADELILYMVDHGGEELFHLDHGDYVTAGELKAWLDALQQNRAMRVIVIVDACMSGGFLNGLALTGGVHEQSERIVIASAEANRRAWFESDGNKSFSRYFWDKAYLTGRLFRSYIYGRERMVEQNPLADRDGDGTADEITLVGLVDDPASEILIGRGRIAASTPPEIGGICDDQTIECETSATITASDIAFYNGEMSVIAQVLPPTYNAKPSYEPVEELSTFRLTRPNVDQDYIGSYDDFTLTGTYRIVVYATDKKDVTSVPRTTRVIRTCGATNIKADLNKDTEADLTDAIIALQILAGVTPIGFRTDFQTAQIDVNGDDPARVDLAEAIYALQKAAGVR